MALAATHIMTEIRGTLYSHLQRLSLAFHNKAKSGDLITRVTYDVERIREATVTAALPLFTNVFTLTGMLGVMLWMNWELALIAIAVFPLFILVSAHLSKQIQKVARKQRKREGAMAATAAEAMGAIKVVQALSLQGMLESSFDKNNQKSLQEGAESQKLAAGLERTVEMLVAIATALILWRGVQLVLDKLVSPGELAEFERELAGLRGRIENLSQRLDAVQQFSTTTTLDGEALVGVIGVEGNEKADGEGDVDSNLTFGYRLRLNFDTSFTGKDRLRTRLQANNIPKVSDAAETDMANLSFQGESDNQFELSRLEYRFPINQQAVVYVEAVGGSLNDYTDTLNPFLSGSSRGTVSRFGQRNPIYRHGEGSGIGISYAFSKSVSLDVGFVADKVNDPEIGFGKAAYGAIAQLTVRPTNNIGVGLTYVRSYNSLDTGTGSDRANDPFDGESDAIAANSFGIQSTVKISRQITAGGWVGYTRAQALDLGDRPQASMFNWAVTLAFPDLGSEDSVGGIVIGQQPKVINSDFIEDDREYTDPDTSLHLEAFYRRQFTDHLAVTLGLLAITNPEHNSNNDPIYIGTLRTTSSF